MDWKGALQSCFNHVRRAWMWLAAGISTAKLTWSYGWPTRISVHLSAQPSNSLRRKRLMAWNSGSIPVPWFNARPPTEMLNLNTGATASGVAVVYLKTQTFAIYILLNTFSFIRSIPHMLDSYMISLNVCYSIFCPPTFYHWGVETTGTPTPRQQEQWPRSPDH